MDKVIICITYLIVFIIFVSYIFFNFDVNKKNNKNLTKNKDVAGFVVCHTTYTLLNNIALKNTCINKLKG